GFRPNNVVGGIPTNALDYRPAWDAQLFEWTKDAIDNGFRGQVREEFQILTFVQDGLITGPGGIPFGSSGFAINCPIVQRLDCPNRAHRNPTLLSAPTPCRSRKLQSRMRSRCLIQWGFPTNQCFG